MTREEYLERISKVESKIEKIKKRINKWTAGMNNEAKEIAKNCELLYEDPLFKERYEAYKAYDKSHRYDDTVYNSNDWNKGPNLEEAYNAYRDLAEAKNTLYKYQVKIQEIDNFNNLEKIEVLWNFLQEWKKQANEYYHEQVKKLYEIDQWYDQECKAASKLTSDSDRETRRSLYREYVAQTRECGVIAQSVRKYRDVVDEEKLNKILDKEVELKYKDFVRRITEKVGEIKDVSDLKIGYDGNINGIVVGSKGKARVETIGAGGYNIQIFHYRVLVHTI